jgi:hypothetical protein
MNDDSRDSSASRGSGGDELGAIVSYVFLGGPRDREILNSRRYINALTIPATDGGMHWYEAATEARRNGDGWEYRNTLVYVGKRYREFACSC